MMPLTFAKPGQQYTIQKVGGKEDTRKFLENLGFVSGADTTIISTASGNLIVDIKGSRVAVSREMAAKIMV